MEDNVRRLRRDQNLPEIFSSQPRIGRVCQHSEIGLLLEFDGSAPVLARMTVDLSRLRPEAVVGREVLVAFEQGDPGRPIAIALIHGEETQGHEDSAAADTPAMQAEVDDDELVLTAKRRIRLQCGKASITITRDGKVVVRGTNLLSRSSGPLRIKGGHVEIN